MSLKNTTKVIEETIASLPADISSLNGEDKMTLLAACDKLRMSLETAGETTFRVMTGTHFHVALVHLINLGVFDVMADKYDGMDVESLGKLVNCEPNLLIRFMRAAAGISFFRQVGEAKYAATDKTKSLVKGAPLADAILQFAIAGQVLTKTPDYFRDRGYKNPDDTNNGPFQYAFNTDLQYFGWLAKNPEQQKAFNSMMESNRHMQGHQWYDVYPVEEKLKIKDANAPLIVDVGGGKGSDISAFQTKYPDFPGRLIMQDLATTIDAIVPGTLGPKVETQVYDFFTPQPVKGAKVYYMRNIIHDWPDKQAREILNMARDAMDENSLLIINENALPDFDIPMWGLALDLTMMAYFSAHDRTVKQYTELIESTGFKMQKVYTTPAEVSEPIFVFEAVKI